MAIAPFPFFYSPPYACPSAAAYPPPTPGSFPAPAYDPYSFSSAATYHQPPHFTSPAFPYAATYPYPPPPSSFSPNWPIWPPPAPSPLPYPSTFSTTTTSFTLTSGCVRFPQPPLAETPAMAPTSRPDQAPGAPLAIDLSSLTPQPLDSIPTVTSRKHCKSRTPQADLFYSKPIKVTRGHASTGRTISELHVHEIPCVMKNKGSAYLPAPATKDTDCFNHASEVTSSAPTSRPQFFSSNTKGTGFGLSASSTPTAQASYFGFIASGSTTTSVSAPSTLPDTGPVVCGSSSPAHLFSNTTTSSPATTAAMALSTHSTGTVYAGPKVFGQMPTPRPGYEHYCDVHQNPNPIQSSSVHGGSTNLHEKYVDEVLQSYGFNNLISRSLFLADDDDTDGFSSEFVHVLSSTPDQQSYEAEQQDSEQLLKCVGKALKAEQTIVCLNYSSHLFDCTLAQQQQNDEKASLNVQQPRESHWNVLVIHERRNGWDPGIHTFFSSTQTSDIHYFHQTSILPKSGIPLLNGVLAARIQLGISKCFVPRQCNYRVPSRLMNPGIHFLWDPGILNQLDIMPEETAVPNLLRNGQKKFKLLIFIGKHVGSKQFWAQLLLHCHSWCTTPSVFLRVQSCCLSIILDYLYSEPVKQLVCYCSIFNWTVVSLSTIVHMRLVLSAGKIVQGRDVWDPGAATFHVRFMTADDATKLQCIDVYKSAMIQILAVKLGARNTPIFATAIMCFDAFDLRWTEMNAATVLVQVVPYSKDTYVAKHTKTRQVQWDPGIIFTLYELWWLSKGTEYALRHLLAVKFGTHNSTYLRDTAAIICDPPANLIQQRRTTAVWESLSSIVCTWDPGIAFVHHQGVYEYYNAKNLLFPQNYLQIWEMDNIFITFLPP